MHTELEVDAPRCPSCHYHLTGLTTLICPECGLGLQADFARYRPSQSTPWSTQKRPPLLRGLSWVLFHPIRTFSRIDSPWDATLGRVISFAVLYIVIGLMVWVPLRELIQAASASFFESRVAGRQVLRYFALRYHD